MHIGRWQAVIGILVVVLLAAIPIGLFLVVDDGDSSDEAAASATASASTQPTDAAGEPVDPDANAPGVAIVAEGGVALSGVSATRPGADSVVVSFQADRESDVAVQARNQAGAEVGQSSARKEPGQSVVVVPLARSVSGTLRLVLAAAPTDGGAATIASVAVGPRRTLVRVVSPTPGSVIAGDRVVVELRTRNFAVSDQGRAPAPNQGHFHLTLDERTYVVAYGKHFTFRDVAPGPHRLVVGTHDHDHAPQEGVEEIAIEFETTAG